MIGKKRGRESFHDERKRETFDFSVPNIALNMDACKSGARRLAWAMPRMLLVAPSALRMTTRFLTGASRRQSSGCNGQSPTRARSRVRLPLIRNAVGRQ